MTEIVDVADLETRPGAVALDGEPRVIRLALDAGETVPAHDHPGTTVLLFVVAGTVAVELDGAAHELAAGELLRFDGDRAIAIEAIDDATALVTLVEA